MAKKSGKSAKTKKASDKSGFTIAGIDIPAALRSNGVNVDTLTKHPLVAGLAAMALESLANQIRAKVAGSTAPAPTPEPNDPAPAAKPRTARKSAAKTAVPKKAPPKKQAVAKPAAAKAATRKPATKKTPAKPKPAA